MNMNGIMKNIQDKIARLQALIETSAEGVESLREEIARLRKMEMEESERESNNRILLRD